MTHPDVIVAGAGIIGLSVAWQLALRSNLDICVLERGAGVGEGSTGASSAVCRCRYSRDEMLELARDGVSAYRDWAAFTRLTEPRARFQGGGVLWMPGGDPHWADTEHARLQGFGIPAEVLDSEALTRAFPALSACTLSPDTVSGEPHTCRDGGRHLLETDGGYIDPVSAAQDLVEACRSRGVRVRFNTRVSEVRTRGGRVEGVRLASGESIDSPCLVNATGPWCRELNAAAGVDLSWNLVPTRIQVLYLDRPAELPGHIPVAIDMASGIYFRSQNRGQQLLVSSVLERDEREAVEDPDTLDREPDDLFRQRILHALHHRIPGLPYRGKVRGYCGLYTVNRDDVHPVIGALGPEGYWLANGFSGHGFKLAPAIGGMLARALCGRDGAYDTAIPLEFFSPQRSPIPLESRTVLA